MTSASAPLHVFVAMPGQMPGGAIWPDVPAIKRQLYPEIETAVERRLGRPVKTIIETDKTQAGDIHESMWREALRAGAYIADLTGANANVYMELGVRWALSEGPTVLICQHSDEGVLFNVQNARVIRYGPNFDQVRQAADQIAQAIVDGLRRPGSGDSPVLKRLGSAVVARKYYEALVEQNRALQEEVARLRAEKVDELLSAADAERDPVARIGHLAAAVERAPGNVAARYKLGLTLLEAGRNAEAASALEHATRLDPNRPDLWWQLAVARSRGGELQGAEEALGMALELNPDDVDAWATRGGNYRRLARAGGVELNWELMEKARGAYKRAAGIRRNDSYLQLNVAQLDLLLSRGDPETRQRATQHLQRVESLVLLEIEGEEEDRDFDPWNRFKVLTVKALTCRHGEASAGIGEAMERIPMAARRSYAQATIGPLEDCLLAGILEPDATEGLQRFVDALRQAAAPPDSAR